MVTGDLASMYVISPPVQINRPSNWFIENFLFRSLTTERFATLSDPSKIISYSEKIRFRRLEPIVPDVFVMIFEPETDDLPWRKELSLSTFQITDGLKSKISRIGTDHEILASLKALALILPLPSHRVPEVFDRLIGIWGFPSRNLVTRLAGILHIVRIIKRPEMTIIDFLMDMRF